MIYGKKCIELVAAIGRMTLFSLAIWSHCLKLIRKLLSLSKLKSFSRLALHSRLVIVCLLALTPNGPAWANAAKCHEFFSVQLQDQTQTQTQSQREYQARVNKNTEFGLTSVGIVKPRDIASFLAWVKRHIPLLYHNTKDFPVNFWEAIRERNSLEELMREFPVYLEYLKHKTHLLSFRIQSEKSNPYRFDLVGFKSQVESESPEGLSVEEARQRINTLVASQGPGSSSLLLTDLMFKVDGPDRGVMSKKATIDGLYDYFKQKGAIPPSFRGQSHGLTPPWSIERVRARYFELVESEKQVIKLKKWLLLKQISSMPEVDDSVAATILLSLPDKELKAALDSFVKKLESDNDSALGKVDILLKEIPDSLAMLKSCVGKECTPPRFAALPGERAFFIYDSEKPNEPKGYLSLAEIKTKEGSKVLYFKQFQGPKIAVETAQAILLVATQLAQDMGYDYAIIAGRPHSNYPILSQPWQEFVDR
jgi:hypothetical protein